MRHLKGIIEYIFAVFYAIVISFFDKKPRRVVLCYHGVNKADIGHFTKQMTYLSKKCLVVKPSEIINLPANGDKVVVAITFDDAFMNTTDNAMPILKDKGLTAGVFIPVGDLGQPPRWEIAKNCPDKNEAILNLKQIVELYNDGFEIFSHTVSHPMLTQVDEDRLRVELCKSKKELERIIGREVFGLSYPYGAFDTRVCIAAKRAGYKFAFTMEPRMVGFSSDNMQIGRFEVSPRDSVLKFSLKVKGAYRVVKYLQRMKRLLRMWMIG